MYKRQAPGFGGITESMTLTQAGNLVDIDSTSGFQIRKLSATGAVDLITMANELVEPKDSVSAKIFIRNIGYNKREKYCNDNTIYYII